MTCDGAGFGNHKYGCNTASPRYKSCGGNIWCSPEVASGEMEEDADVSAAVQGSGYSSPLYSGSCCKHNAPWDDQFTPMFQLQCRAVATRRLCTPEAAASTTRLGTTSLRRCFSCSAGQWLLVASVLRKLPQAQRALGRPVYANVQDVRIRHDRQGIGLEEVLLVERWQGQVRDHVRQVGFGRCKLRWQEQRQRRQTALLSEMLVQAEAEDGQPERLQVQQEEAIRAGRWLQPVEQLHQPGRRGWSCAVPCALQEWRLGTQRLVVPVLLERPLQLCQVQLG